MQSYHSRNRGKKKAIAKDGGIVRHSGWHATFKQREADIRAGRISANSHKDAEAAQLGFREKSFVQFKKKRTVFDRDEEKTDLVGYLAWLGERTSKLEEDALHPFVADEGLHSNLNDFLSRVRSDRFDR